MSGGRGDLPLAVLDTLLRGAKARGFEELAFTGGEPTLHPRFFEIVERTAEAGYTYGLVSNGWNFPHVYSRLLPFRDQLAGITFSLDGATEATHDALRGTGSYRRLLQAISVCVASDLPFSLNMVVTRRNRTELAALAELGAALGARGVRYGPLMPGGDPTLELTLEERRASESAIRALQPGSPIPVALAPGYETDELFPCAPLNLEEFNIDWRGNLTHCCHLSGYADSGTDIVGNLRVLSFSEAWSRLRAANARFIREKQTRQAAGRLSEADRFPCLYCCGYFNKLASGRADHRQPTASLQGDLSPCSWHPPEERTTC